MIQSNEDYEFYLEADRIALGITHRRPRFFGDDVWKLERLLRKAEYFQNCKKGLLSRIYFKYLSYKLSLRFGFCILACIFYSGPIIVNPKAKVGENCRISSCVTIGGADVSHTPPRIGDNVFIGLGAVIVGSIVQTGLP
jgi:serine O-acetyltransferase